MAPQKSSKLCISQQILIFLIIFYRYTLSVFIGGRCRFFPSCSEYAEQSIKKHGALCGTFYSISRIFRCNPLGSYGYDPVPQNIDLAKNKN